MLLQVKNKKRLTNYLINLLKMKLENFNEICSIITIFLCHTGVKFEPAWVQLGLLRKPYNRLNVNTIVKSRPAVFSRPYFGPNWSFTSGIFCMILTCQKKFFSLRIFHAELTSEEIISFRILHFRQYWND